MQWRGFHRGAGVTADQVQLRDRHVQAVALGVFDFQVFAGRAAGIQHHQPAVTAHAMVFMDDGRAFAQFAQVADDGFRFAPGALAPVRLRGALGKQLAFGQYRDLRVVQGEAVFKWGHGQCEARGAAQEGGEVGDHFRCQCRSLHHFHQGFAAPRGIRRYQHASLVA